MEIDLPNNAWSLTDKQEQTGSIVYYFKRDPIDDSAGRHVIPNIAFIVENVAKNVDVVSYSVSKRSQVNFKVDSVFTHEKGPIELKNAIGYKGEYIDSGGLPHTVYVIHVVNDKKGIQIIMDATAEIFPSVHAEFLRALRSIRMVAR